MPIDLDWIAGESLDLLRPLAASLRTRRALAGLLARVGRTGEPAALDAGLERLAVVVERIDALIAEREAGGAGGAGGIATTFDEVVEILRAVVDLRDDIPALAVALADRGLPVAEAHLLELASLLVIAQVRRAHPIVYTTLELLGVVVRDEIPADPRVPGAIDRVTYRIDGGNLATAIQAPGQLATRVYGWGTDAFDATLLMTRIARVAESAGLPARTSELDEVTQAAIAPGLGEDLPWVAKIFVLDEPVQTPGGTSNVRIGVALVPVPGATPNDGGLAVMPLVEGTTVAELAITDEVSLAIEGSGAITGGLALLVRPSGIEAKAGILDGNLGAAAEGAITVRWSEADRLVVGADGGIGVRIGDSSLTLRFAPGDLGLELGVPSVSVSLAPSQGGGVFALLPAATVDIDSGLTLGISVKRGVYLRIGDWTATLETDPGSATLRFTPDANHDDLLVCTAAGFQVYLIGRRDVEVTVGTDAGRPVVRLAGAMKIELPIDAIVDDAGAALSVEGSGTLVVSVDAPPSLVIDEVSAHATGVQLGGNGGARVEDAELAIRGLRFPIPDGPMPFTITAAGRLTLAGADVRVKGTLVPDGVEVVATGECALGGGVRVREIDANTPILLATIARATGSPVPVRIDAAFAGAIDLPHGAGPSRASLRGELHLIARAAERDVIVDSVAASAQLGDWPLADGVTLTGASASLAWDDGRFTVELAGGVSIDSLAIEGATAAARFAAVVTYDANDPGALRLDGALEHASVALGDDVRVFDTTLHVAARTRPAAGEPPIAIAIEHGAAGLFRKPGATGATPDDFHLAVEDVEIALGLGPGGLDLDITSGALLLPDLFTDAAGVTPAAPPSIAVVAPGVHIAVRPAATRSISFAGAIALQNLRVALPGGAGSVAAEAILDQATLTFAGIDLPRLCSARGRVRLPLPNGRVLALSFGANGDATWSLDGFPLPAVEIQLDEHAVLDFGEDLSIALLGATPDTSDAYRTRFSVEAGAPGAPGPRFTFRAGVEIRLPLSAVTEHDGDRVTARAGGTITIEPVPGAAPAIAISDLAVTFSPEVYFRLGGATGVSLYGSIEARSLEHLLSPDATHPVVFDVSGAIRVVVDDPADTFGVELTNAILTFYGADRLPSFSFERVAVDTSALRKIDGIPFRIMNPAITLKNPALPFPDSFAASNVILEMSLEAGLPIAEGIPSANARADGVTVTFRPDGFPERPSIRGIGMGVKDLDVGVATMDAYIYVGGLPPIGQPIDRMNPPLPPFFAGKAGGKANGMGMKLLLDFGRPDRSGVAVDVSAGPAGIVLGQTGFVITGVSGGISFANSTRDPTDIATYIDADGRLVEADLPPATPRPPEEAAPSTATIDSATEFPCPGEECPPPSVNILCQPHPTVADRVILKHTSLDEADLALLGLTPASVNGRQPEHIARELIDKIGGRAEWLTPPEAVRRRLDAALESLVRWVTAQLAERLALDPPPTAYDALRFVAALGLPCPDVTLQVTGTGSHLAVSSFLTLTGGFRVSTAGAVGVIGSVNVFGIPVGKVWGFLTGTDAQGNPDVSLCGTIKCAIGPLELGVLRFSFGCTGCITGLAGVALQAAGTLGPATLQALVKDIAPAITPPADPAQLLALLDDAQLIGLLGALYRPPFTDEVKACLLELVTGAWDNFKPAILLCGQVKPKFFGIPLMPDAVAVRGHVTKRQFAVQIAFAPSLLITCLIEPRYLPPFDSAEIGFRVMFPDAIVVDLLLHHGGALTDPAAAQALAAHVFDEFLATLTVAGKYTFAPLGLKLAQAEMRLMMPDLLHHPEHPGAQPRPWTPLDTRDPARFPRRSPRRALRLRRP